MVVPTPVHDLPVNGTSLLVPERHRQLLTQTVHQSGMNLAISIVLPKIPFPCKASCGDGSMNSMSSLKDLTSRHAQPVTMLDGFIWGHINNGGVQRLLRFIKALFIKKAMNGTGK